MQDVMLDLETLGTVPGSVIISIGAVCFDPASRALGAEFYTVVSVASCREAGLTLDPDTIAWWGDQGADAKTVLDIASTAGQTLTDALKAFAVFLPAGARVWGNGSDFDNALIASACRAVSLPLPWKFWNSRCYRTLKGLFPGVYAPPRVGVHHNALDDAKYQTGHAVAIFNHMERIAEG
jgi:hypothetical protein